MRQYSVGIDIVERVARRPRTGMVLQFEQPLQKRVSQSVAQRIAHGYVHRAYVFGQSVKQRHQQILVRQHHGGLLVQFPVAGKVAKHRNRIFALYDVRPCGDRMQRADIAEVIVAHAAFGRQFADTLPHEQSRLLRLVGYIIVVVIPEEIDIVIVREIGEQPSFAGRKRVESRHDVTARRQRICIAAIYSPDRLAIYHAGICNAERAQTFAILVVNGAERPPDCQKPPFLLRKRRLLAYRPPEIGYYAQLFFGEIADIGFQLLYIGYVAEKLRRIDHVFVYHVEIGKQHFAPEIEFVETFVVIFGIYAVEFGYQSDFIGRTQFSQLRHHVVHRQIFGFPNRAVGNRRERIGEEKPRTPRREHYRQRRNVVAVFGIEPAGDL